MYWLLLSAVFADCISDPTNNDCSSFEYKDAIKDVQSLCMMMPQMPGCTIARICETTSKSPFVCDPMSILADICVADTMSGMSGCHTYLKMCVKGSKVPKCSSQVPVPSIPTTGEAKNFGKALCPDPSNCGTCDLINAPYKCDLLSLYSQLCSSSSDRKECSKWRNMCKVSEKNGGVREWPELCSNSFVDPVDLNCLENPVSPACVDFIYNDAQSDVKSLCEDMPNMPGCSIYSVCQKKGIVSMSCNPINDICIVDHMTGMDGCTNYAKLCAKGTKVKQCSVYQPIPDIPSTDEVLKLSTSICDSHYMDGCQTCDLHSNPSDCDLLSLYSNLCKAMPYMKQCGKWKNMCSASSSSFSIQSWNEFCPSENNEMDPPIMRMYFHNGIADYVLFYSWVPRTTTQYWFTLIAIVIIGILYEGIRTVRYWFEKAWFDVATSITKPAKKSGCCGSGTTANEKSPLLEERSCSPCCAGNSPEPSLYLKPLSFSKAFGVSVRSQIQPFDLWTEIIRTLMQMIEVTLAYALMLIAMSFNYGMFFAVILGIGLGTFAFARFRAYNPSCGCC